MVNEIQCYKCKKYNIDGSKTKTRVVFGNYKYVQLSQMMGGVYVCESCSNKLRKWLTNEK